MLKRINLPVILVVLAFGCSSDKEYVGSPMGIGDEDDPYARLAYDHERLKDPTTGEIPVGIRKAELAYAKTLPKRPQNKSLTWDWRGPDNRGGRTRALGIDVLDTNIIIAGGVTGGMWRSDDGGNSWLKTSAAGHIQSVSCVTQDTRPGHESTWYYGTGENYGIASGTSFSALVSGDGIFKSTDNGQSWTQLPSTIADRPENYAISGTFKQVSRIVIDPVDTNDVVMAAVFNGIMRSEDGGTSWTNVLGADTGATSVTENSDIQVSSNGTYYASMGNGTLLKGLYRSTDGISWVRISNGAGYPSNIERTVIAIDPHDENKVYFFGQANTSSGGTNGHFLFVYRYLSGDGSGAGGSWENRSGNLPNTDCTGYFTFNFGPINTQSGYDMCMIVHPLDSNVLYIGGTNVYRSMNAFRSADSTKWIGGYKCTPSDPKDYVYDNHHPDIHIMLFNPLDPDILWTGSDGGVHRSFDPLADSVIWQDRNDGYVTSQFYTVHLEEGAANDDRLIGGTQDNGTYYNASNNTVDWHWVHRDDGAYAALPSGADFILTSSQRGRLYKKELNANNEVIGFERIDPTTGASQNEYNFINQFVLDPRNNNQLYWVSKSRIIRNTDLAGIPINNNWYNRIGTNWEVVSASTLSSSQRITTLDISYWGGSLMYGTANRNVYRLDSLGGNETRVNVSSPDWPGNSYVSCVAPNDHNPDEWMVTYSNYGVQSVWHTLDNGSSWTHVSGNLEENPDGTGSGPACFWATIYPDGGSGAPIYFVGTSVGLYSTELLDGDNTIWSQEGANSIGLVPVNMITTRLDDGIIAVGTHGNGMYSSSLPSAPVSVTDPLVPVNATPAFPNPASELITFPFTLDEPGTITVEVYGINGGLIVSENLGQLSSGDHQHIWELRNSAGQRVAPGHYIARVQNGTRSHTNFNFIVKH